MTKRPEAPLDTDVGIEATAHGIARAFLVVHVDGQQRASSVVTMPDGVEVTVGRSRGATISAKGETVSRLHARIRRAGDVLDIQDLDSRNGTHVNGERISSRRRLDNGDEVAIGPIHIVVCITSSLSTRHRIVTNPNELEMRFAAEVDRSVLYRRPLTVALARIADDGAVDAMARELRPMDLIAHDGGEDYLVLLPELGPLEGSAMVERLIAAARKSCAHANATTLWCPKDGTTHGELLEALRDVRKGRRAGRVERGDGLIVQEPAMHRVYDLVRRVADNVLTVLILGETGVGKECVAEALHAESKRRTGPFLRVNCASLSETLLDTELFGYERGAFTGAEKSKIGLFEAAAGGTLFLDEIGDLGPGLQVKLLRALDHKAIARVGAITQTPVDVRVVAATHHDLVSEMRAGRFRQDLFHRLSGFMISVPPLRERPSEILPLAEHFLRAAANELQRPPPVVSADARDALVGYTWPGNVRELKNAINRAAVMCGEDLTADDLPEPLRDARRRLRPMEPPGTIRGQLDQMERAVIVAALEAEQHNQTRAARRLGISRRALVYKLGKYGVR